MLDEKDKVESKPEYTPPKIVEKKELEIELFSDEPDPWGCGGP
jgi:hypothetical protein